MTDSVQELAQALGGREIRPLSLTTNSESILAAVDRQIAALPADTNYAVIAHATVENGHLEGKLFAMFRVRDKLSFGGYLEKPYDGSIVGGAELRFVG